MRRQALNTELAAIRDAVAPDAGAVLIVSRAPVELDEWRSCHFEAVDKLNLDAKADLGIAVSPRPGDSPALARLRDVLCQRVALLSPEGWDRNDLLALGFVRQSACYLYDPAIQDRPREWNNPKDWANPENFDKFRW